MSNSQQEMVPSFGATVLPPLVAFVVAGLVSPLYSNESFGIGQAVWSAVVLWPIGLVLVGVPVLILLAVRTRRLLRVGQILIGSLGVLSMVAVARSDDAQAGAAFMYAPIGGSVLAVLLLGVDGRLRR